MTQQIQVEYRSTAEIFGAEIIPDDTVISEYLEDKNAYMGAQFNINGRIIDNNELRMTFAEAIDDFGLNRDRTIKIYETAKTAGA